MSDGGGGAGGRDGRKGQKKSDGTPPGGGDDFGRAVARIAVAQICDSSGLQGCQRSALDALADVAIRYICDLGRIAHFYAGLSGRTDCNVFDVVQGLEDLSFSHGFESASDVHRCLVASGVVRDVTRYAGTAKEVPFARHIPNFPIPRSLKPTPSFAQIGEAPSGKHVPDWLPAFPDVHTYVHTPVWNEKSTDPRADKMEQARQRRKAERSLLSLQQRLASNGASGLVFPVNGGAGKGKQVACNNNPFLAEPLQHNEKEVSEIAAARDEPSGLQVLEAFAPAIEAAKTGSFDPEMSDREILPDKRPKVHFKVGINKKSVAVSLASGTLSTRRDSLFLREDEKDDKKRRAEMILKESMDNPEELMQL